jgi:hypothetical protein
MREWAAYRAISGMALKRSGDRLGFFGFSDEGLEKVAERAVESAYLIHSGCLWVSNIN